MIKEFEKLSIKDLKNSKSLSEIGVYNFIVLKLL